MPQLCGVAVPSLMANDLRPSTAHEAEGDLRHTRRAVQPVDAHALAKRRDWLAEIEAGSLGKQLAPSQRISLSEDANSKRPRGYDESNGGMKRPR